MRRTDNKHPLVAPSHGVLEILVIEDDRDAADSLAMLLRLGGHRVQVAYTGPVGLLMAQQKKPDVVLLDLGLPRVDGFSVVDQLRSRLETKDAFIVAVTGYGEEQVKQRCIEAGFDFHLLKPISTEWLLSYLRDNSRCDKPLPMLSLDRNGP